jgi:hypothetical protein
MQKKPHKTELRTVRSSYKRSFCLQKGCKFYGKEAQQGICHTEPDTHDNWDLVDRHLALAEKHGEDYVKEIKTIYKGNKRAYIKYLENTVAVHWMQETSNLDEVIALRRRISLLKHKVQNQIRQLKELEESLLAQRLKGIDTETQIIVNGRKKIWLASDPQISYNNVVDLAEGTIPGLLNMSDFYTITYRNGCQESPQGELLRNTEVPVKHGMIFNVAYTGGA